ncbi:hypothetical protein QWZ08_02290 [Ferruginibacter paludis]|uniref:hypothetical protein n=1 Tax=Ferruginibacter paludis TaxID=1310417 RepID=UPI0025B2EC9C|nr:hypothetical protein [Ferruginibacter paludis]MDN3654436.1 hypothetical protein [Ferruginibacter paludis]
MNKEPNPITEHEEVANNPDNKIDQDFNGFPHGAAAEKMINPSTREEKKVAAVNITDGEKVNKRAAEKDEQESDGSGGAFGATENMEDD